MSKSKVSAPPALSDGEWVLMKSLWEHAPIAVNDLIAKLDPSLTWHPKTVRTMLIRLHKKGVLAQSTVEGVVHYEPLFTREQCSGQAAVSFMDRVFDGALAPLVANFTKQRPLSAEEKQALKQLLDASDD